LLGLRPRPLDYKLHVFLWRTDVEGVYVVTAHLLADRDVYCYMPGGGAGFSFEEALAKALGEVGQAFMFMYDVARVRRKLGGDSTLYYVEKDADPTGPTTSSE
jgi:ribosomal protein S12 methylthiotransferase accessory factor YcaO